MSYVESSEPNPYAAPRSDLEFGEVPRKAQFLGYSGFWRRFAAYFLDSIIMGAVGFVAGSALNAILAATGNSGSTAAAVLLQLVSVAISIAYYAGMESSASQATVGKMALGIRVTDLRGHRISFGRAVGRFFSKIVSALILMIGFIMAAFTERKQALHDMMAGTLVMKVR